MTGAAVASAAVGATSLVQGGREAKKAGERGDQAVSQAEKNIGVAGDLQRQLNAMGAEGMDFAQGLMDNWEGTFGGIQDNLSEYYQNLDPNQYGAQAKSDYAVQMDKQTQQFNDTMAATGLQSAGMKQQAMQEGEFAQAQANAGIDLAAEDKVRGMQQGFVNSGESQRSQATNMMNSALNRQGQFATTGANAVMGANTGVANAYNRQGEAYGQSASGFAGAGGSMLGAGLNLGIQGGAFDSKPQGYQRPSSGVNSKQWSQNQVNLANQGR